MNTELIYRLLRAVEQCRNVKRESFDLLVFQNESGNMLRFERQITGSWRLGDMYVSHSSPYPASDLWLFLTGMHEKLWGVSNRNLVGRMC